MSDAFAEEKVTFDSEGLSLSGVLSYPEAGAPRVAVLLCGPHPNFAGNMDNNVIRALAARLAPRAIVLRFNYRGVGESQIRLGENESVYDYWAEIEEAQRYDVPLADVRAATHVLHSLAPKLPTFIIGYSFGAIVGLMAGLAHLRVAGLIGIAPPLLRHPFDFLKSARKTTLLLSGRHDFVFAESLAASEWPACVRQQILDDHDHFFRGAEHIVSDLCAGMIDGILNQSGEPRP